MGFLGTFVGHNDLLWVFVRFYPKAAVRICLLEFEEYIIYICIYLFRLCNHNIIIYIYGGGTPGTVCVYTPEICT